MENKLFEGLWENYKLSWQNLTAYKNFFDTATFRSTLINSLQGFISWHKNRAFCFLTSESWYPLTVLFCSILSEFSQHVLIYWGENERWCEFWISLSSESSSINFCTKLFSNFTVNCLSTKFLIKHKVPNL